jgi:hypothetical protein
MKKIDKEGVEWLVEMDVLQPNLETTRTMKEETIEELKKYFVVTPRDKVLEDWEKSSEFDNVRPTVEEFLQQSKQQEQ